jgi:hypothetical protein
MLTKKCPSSKREGMAAKTVRELGSQKDVVGEGSEHVEATKGRKKNKFWPCKSEKKSEMYEKFWDPIWNETDVVTQPHRVNPRDLKKAFEKTGNTAEDDVDMDPFDGEGKGKDKKRFGGRERGKGCRIDLDPEEPAWNQERFAKADAERKEGRSSADLKIA